MRTATVHYSGNIVENSFEQINLGLITSALHLFIYLLHLAPVASRSLHSKPNGIMGSVDVVVHALR